MLLLWYLYRAEFPAGTSQRTGRAGTIKRGKKRRRDEHTSDHGTGAKVKKVAYYQCILVCMYNVPIRIESKVECAYDIVCLVHVCEREIDT